METQMTHLADDANLVRAYAEKGAASILDPRRLAEIREIGSVVVGIFFNECSKHSSERKVIENPRSWGYKVGRNEAIAWRKAESCIKEFKGDEVESREDQIIAWNEESYKKREVLAALPELFAVFQEKVVSKLSKQDLEFFELYYLDHWDEERLALKYGIKPKAVRQRWHRLLAKMYRSLLAELHAWNQGKEVFKDAFDDSKSIIGLLCLIRIFMEKGWDAVCELVESMQKQ